MRHLVAQLPPQSFAVSVPFLMPSLQVGAMHTPAVHLALAQSVATTQTLPVSQVGQPSPPPQSTSVSSPFCSPSAHSLPAFAVPALPRASAASAVSGSSAEGPSPGIPAVSSPVSDTSAAQLAKPSTTPELKSPSASTQFTALIGNFIVSAPWTNCGQHCHRP